MHWLQDHLFRVACGQREISVVGVSELRRLTSEAMKGNVVARKWLQTYIGKCSVFASVFVLWLPFLSELHAALSSLAEEAEAPHSCIWKRQIRPALLRISECSCTGYPGACSGIFGWVHTLVGHRQRCIVLVSWWILDD